ncbi:MAG: molybdopterin converting factor subunit 1 [Gammaproteobacteria bacterium]|jgi:molybdopterin synthase sulfur carrier subunit|nr:molybdopterin converting factor subunit 1 [Gammaproteobacteria bacterium]MBQ0775266.1 molybdopterin converting factor subunit 1 [Gammaproteobacteria bacterium]|tara:strand:+ start:28202 stop:28456 length:255 start_codon:yes stop_codon:yes gene_type:complete
MIKVRYFASLRERVGCEDESIEWSEQRRSVADLRAHLCGRGGVWEEAFAADSLIMCAINEELATSAALLADEDEIAFFPPVTGG